MTSSWEAADPTPEEIAQYQREADEYWAQPAQEAWVGEIRQQVATGTERPVMTRKRLAALLLHRHR